MVSVNELVWRRVWQNLLPPLDEVTSSTQAVISGVKCLWRPERTPKIGEKCQC